MSTIAQTLRHAAHALDRYSDSPRLDAELLLGKLLGQPRSGLIARSDKPVAAASEHAFAELIEARRGGAPVAYLTGSRELWSLPLRATRRLAPRLLVRTGGRRALRLDRRQPTLRRRRRPRAGETSGRTRDRACRRTHRSRSLGRDCRRGS